MALKTFALLSLAASMVWQRAQSALAPQQYNFLYFMVINTPTQVELGH